MIREYAEKGVKLIVGEAFSVETGARKVAADYPDVAMLLGSSFAPEALNFSVFDNFIHEPSYLTGMIAGAETKSNLIGIVGGFANDGISLTLQRGEVVALLGENGNLGRLPPGSPQTALEAGIGMVHQHFTLAENLTRFENILLGVEPLFGLYVGAQTDVHNRLLAARECGAGIVLISEDLDELFALADRIVVIHASNLEDTGAIENLDRTAVGLMMAGHQDEVRAS